MTYSPSAIYRVRTLAVRVVVAGALMVAIGALSAVSARADETVYSCGATPNEVFGHAAVFGINTTQTCQTTPGLADLRIHSANNSVAQGQRATWEAVAPPGLLIRDATIPTLHASDVNDGVKQYGGGFFWGPQNSDGVEYNDFSQTAAYGVDDGTAGFPSTDFGFQLVCGANPCTDPNAYAYVPQVTLDVEETSGPALGAWGLWGQTGWVRGDWPISVAGDSPSGVCVLATAVDNQLVAQQRFPQDVAAWHQCNAAGGLSATIKTAQFPNGDDQLTVSGGDAAGEGANPSRTIQIDNAPPTVALSTPDDPDVNVWVNHAVTVQAAASAGPSGIAGTVCSVNGGASSAYPDGGLTVNGDGAHLVSCTASNNAVDPQGGRGSGSASETVKIDQAPPSVAFEPVNPADPTSLVVDTGDSESGVAGGSITMQGPQAAAPTPLPTSFDGSHLLSRFNDAGKHGDYTFTATSCDAVGNCAATSATLHFPIRLGSDSTVSFAKIQAPAKVVHRRVRVGYHYKTVRRRVRVGYRLETVHRRRHGKPVTRHIKVGGHFTHVRRRIKVGGHEKRVKVQIGVNRACGHRRVKIRRHHWRELTVCRKLKLRVVARHRVHFGHRATVHGLLVTAQGAPIPGVPVTVLTRPDDRGGVFSPATTATTNASGVWTATLRGGPSRTIHAYYAGSATVEPATGTATLTVPAKIRLHITPHVVPWSHAIHISGHLVGRYVPHDGVALRLLVRYPHVRQRTVLEALRTNRHGAFAFTWTYHAGRGVARYPFSIATTATETDYPYAAGKSPSVKVTFGKRTPRARRRRAHRRRTHRTRGG